MTRRRICCAIPVMLRFVFWFLPKSVFRFSQIFFRNRTSRSFSSFSLSQNSNGGLVSRRATTTERIANKARRIRFDCGRFTVKRCIFGCFPESLNSTKFAFQSPIKNFLKFQIKFVRWVGRFQKGVWVNLLNWRCFLEFKPVNLVHTAEKSKKSIHFLSKTDLRCES